MMLKKFLQIIVFFTLGLVSNSLTAQDPNWSINPNDFQHSMTFTTFLNVNGTTLTSENDKVAAFIDDEVRGVANVTYVASRNKYVAYLTVFSNSSGNEISFKIYDSQNEAIVEVDKKEFFVIDGNVGGIFQSYSIANPILSNQASIVDFSFKNVTEVSKITNGNDFNFVLPSNTDITQLTPEFTLVEGAKLFINTEQQTSGNPALDFTNNITYIVLSEDESIAVDYTINVELQSNAKTIISTLSTTSPSESNNNEVEVNVNFSKDILVFSSDFIVTNAVTIEETKIDNQNYTIKLIAIEEGDFSIQLNEGVVQDVDGNTNQVSNNLSFSFDTTAPIITNIELKEEPNQHYFDVEFSEAVSNVDVSDFEFIGTLSSSYSKENVVKISDSAYQLNVSKSNELLGSIFLKLATNSDISDKVNNTILIQESQSFYLDNELPIVEVIPDITAECQVTVTTIPKAIDAFSSEILGTTTDALTYTEQGEYTITWSFDDGNGNVSTANQKVIVKDEIPPTIIVKDVELELDASGNATIEVPDLDDGSFDNCGIASYNLSKTVFTEDDLGENTVLFTVEDVNGNSDSKEVIITVVENSLSTDNFQLKNNIRFYPNPVKEKLFLEVKNNFNIHSIDIFSIEGKKILSKKADFSFINVKSVASGLYFVNIKSDRGNVVYKFLRK